MTVMSVAIIDWFEMTKFLQDLSAAFAVPIIAPSMLTDRGLSDRGDRGAELRASCSSQINACINSCTHRSSEAKTIPAS